VKWPFGRKQPAVAKPASDFFSFGEDLRFAHGPDMFHFYLRRNEAGGLVVRTFLLVVSVPQGGEAHAEAKVNSSMCGQLVAWAKNSSQSERWPTPYGIVITDRSGKRFMALTYGPHKPTTSPLDHPLVTPRPREGRFSLRIELETEFLEQGSSAVEGRVFEGRVFVEPKQMWEFAEWLARVSG
jgi:hypothetical protein